MSTEKIRIRIKGYDHRILDNAAKKIVETVKRSGGDISGPVPLPTEMFPPDLLTVSTIFFAALSKIL